MPLWRMGNTAVVTDGTNGDRETDNYYGGKVVCESIHDEDAEFIIRAWNLAYSIDSEQPLFALEAAFRAFSQGIKAGTVRYKGLTK